QGLVAHCAIILSRFGEVSVNCTPRRKDGASRQQVLRRLGAFVICASHRKDGASRQAVRILQQEVHAMARRAASSGALRIFI
ncbi:hypothetical protein A2U01_0085361, partial [Trifolium medium]|nr:hypothetical protein [Trifolium medium]